MFVCVLPGDPNRPIHRALELLNGYRDAVRGAHTGLANCGAHRHVDLASHAGGVAEVPVLAIRGMDLY